MKVIICGGRDYHLTAYDYQWLDDFHATLHITEVFHGAALGADTDADTWAHDHGIPRRPFPPEWPTQGKSAGPRRNTVMRDALLAEAGEHGICVIAFPGGRGTADLCRKAAMKHITVWAPHLVGTLTREGHTPADAIALQRPFPQETP